MTAHAPPQSLEYEEAVLGAVLISEPVLAAVSLDVGLRPEHFYQERYGAVFAAMLRLQAEGERVDALTVADRLRRDGAGIEPSRVDALAAAVPVAGNAGTYARRLVELAAFRAKLAAGHRIVDACYREDADALADAEGALAVERASRTEHTSDQMAEHLYAFMDGSGVEAWPLPFVRLTSLLAGGFRRGQTTVLGGHSSHGKSAFAGQATDAVAHEFVRRGDGTVRVYIAEGSPQSWALRFVARHSRLNYGRLVQGKLRDGEHDDYLRAIDDWRRNGVTLVGAHGWTPDEIAQDVRRRRPDFWVVDLLNELNVGRGETNDWDAAVRTLTAVPEITGSHLLLLAHVNEARSTGKAVRPKPTNGDLRSTGMLKNAADNVMFVWRDQNDEGTEILPDGEVYITKARDARLGGVAVEFDGSHQRFAVRADEDGQPF